mmetsp:Transcript_92012/g.176276  ORF Transcript_92012/g.176276 Transcript_92012/m.176276 type:complete len:80 (+) Transcript_92012:843-1082(+)
MDRNQVVAIEQCWGGGNSAGRALGGVSHHTGDAGLRGYRGISHFKAVELRSGLDQGTLILRGDVVLCDIFGHGVTYSQL